MIDSDDDAKPTNFSPIYPNLDCEHPFSLSFQAFLSNIYTSGIALPHFLDTKTMGTAFLLYVYDLSGVSHSSCGNGPHSDYQTAHKALSWVQVPSGG
jgi:hypothetical protein